MYRYYNRNPKEEILPDCVIRAISTALNIPYYDVVKLIIDNADERCCNDLNLYCYEHLLDEVFELEHYVVYDKISVEEIATTFYNSTLLIRIDGHLTCSIKGIIYDLWDCSNEEVTDFWVV